MDEERDCVEALISVISDVAVIYRWYCCFMIYCWKGLISVFDLLLSWLLLVVMIVAFLSFIL
jgi:hypothetical protein